MKKPAENYRDWKKISKIVQVVGSGVRVQAHACGVLKPRPSPWHTAATWDPQTVGGEGGDTRVTPHSPPSLPARFPRRVWTTGMIDGSHGHFLQSSQR